MTLPHQLARWIAIPAPDWHDPAAVSSAVEKASTDARFEAEAQGYALGRRHSLFNRTPFTDLSATLLVEAEVVSGFTPLAEQMAAAARPFRFRR